MKRLAAVVMMIATGVFMVTTLASAQGWGAIQGTYEMVATGACIHSTAFSTLTGAGIPPDPYVYAATGSTTFVSAFVGQGTFTFDSDGTGTMRVIQSCIHPTKATQAVAPPNFLEPSAFSYRFADDGRIIVSVPAAGLELSGRISRDHKTMTLVSAMQLQSGAAGGPTGFQVCDITRILIRVEE
jgi:hypothetical protein